MPLYEYECPKCGQIEEVFSRMNGEHELPNCGSCGTAMERKYSTFSFGAPRPNVIQGFSYENALEIGDEGYEVRARNRIQKAKQNAEADKEVQHRLVKAGVIDKPKGGK